MGRIIRPKMQVLPDSAIVSARNTSTSPPGHFSHKVTGQQPYYLRKPRKGTAPAGEFAAGDKVLLLSHDDGEFCRVADRNGLIVFTAFVALDPL